MKSKQTKFNFLGLLGICALAFGVAACGSGKPDPTPEERGLIPSPENGLTGPDCSQSVARASNFEIPLSTWLDGQPGTYELTQVRFLAKSNYEGFKQSYSVKATGLATHWNTQVDCSFQSVKDIQFHLSATVDLPVAIDRQKGTFDEYMRFDATYYFGNSSLSPTIYSLSLPAQEGSRVALDFSDLNLKVFKLPENQVLVQTTQTKTASDGRVSDLVILTTYRLKAPADGPISVPTPVSPVTPIAPVIPAPSITPAAPILPAIPTAPVIPNLPIPAGPFPAGPIVPMPVITPLPIPGIPAAPAHIVNTRCGVNSYAVTVDGTSAFYELNDDKRLNLLTTLANSGFCAAPSRLGATGTAVTVDGASAVFEPNTETRMSELIRLYAAGLGSDANGRCGAGPNSITFDGKTAFYFLDSKTMVDKFVSLIQSGFCAK